MFTALARAPVLRVQRARRAAEGGRDALATGAGGDEVRHGHLGASDGGEAEVRAHGPLKVCDGAFAVAVNLGEMGIS